MAAASQPALFPLPPIRFHSPPTPMDHSRCETALRAALHRASDVDHFLMRSGTTSLLIYRNHRLLYQSYFNGMTHDRTAPSFSMARSVISLLVGIATAQGKMPPPDTPAAHGLPGVPALRDGMTIRQVMNMTSGFVSHSRNLFGPFSAPWTDNKLTYFSPDLRRVARAVYPQYKPVPTSSMMIATRCSLV